MNETELFCVGNALVDVFAQADEQLCNRHGITLPVQHVEIEKLNAILPHLSEYNTVSGGGAANVAKIASFLGAKACFTGAVGKDSFGQLFEKDLVATGVKLALRAKQLPTGICLILRVANGETRIAASPSASIELSENDIDEEDIKKAKLVVIDGFMLGRGGIASHILRIAGQHGKTVALDLSSTEIAREMASEIAGYAKQYPLILFMNEAEAEAFCGSLSGNAQFRPFFQFITEGNPWPIIAVKLGSRGAICFAGGEVYETETKAVIPYETTGAGDAFCAGFLTAWVRNKTLPECAALGNETAALVLGAEGSQITSLVQKNSGSTEPPFRN